jgi:DNA mismatch repair protein MutS2
VGDRVRVANLHDVGVVTELHGRLATVQLGNLRLKLALDELERVGSAEESSGRILNGRGGAAVLAQEKSQAVGVEVDLRGLTREEAADVLDKYLDDAVLAGAPFVRIIHGKGTGALRQKVHEFLKRDSRVVRYRLGEVGEGGDGVTVALLEEPRAPD